MKILSVVRGLPSHRLGGLEFHAYDLCKALAARGHDVTILTTPLPRGGKAPDLPESIKVHFMPHGDPGNYSPAFFRTADKVISQIDAREKFDVIHAHEFAGLFLRKRTGRFVCTIHGTMFSETPLDRRYFSQIGPAEKLEAIFRYKIRVLLHPFFKRMLHRASRLIVDSDYTRGELLRISSQLDSKIRIVPLGIDFARYPKVAAYREEPHVPVIALLGRLQKMKGVDVAVQAAKQLRDRGISFRMRIAGSGDYADELRRHISENDVEQTIEYCGRIAPEQVPAFFSSADLMLFPDLTQPAFGLVALEAMRYGLPVVGAKSGAIPEVVTDDVGWLYDPWNVAELASTLERALADESERKIRSAAARVRASQFTADVMAEKFERALSS